MIRRILFPALALVFAAAPLGAQPFRSDVTGPIITGSGVAGYPGLPTRDIEAAFFREVGGLTAFRTPAVASAVLAEAAAAQRALCGDSLRAPRGWPAELRMEADAQRAVCGLLARGEQEEALAALAGMANCPPGHPAAELSRALAGLFAAEPRYLDERGRVMAADRWEAALAAYGAYLRTAPDALLDPPTPELLAIAAVLDRVVAAGLRASR